MISVLLKEIATAGSHSQHLSHHIDDSQCT